MSVFVCLHARCHLVGGICYENNISVFHFHVWQHFFLLMIALVLWTFVIMSFLSKCDYVSHTTCFAASDCVVYSQQRDSTLNVHADGQVIYHP